MVQQKWILFNMYFTKSIQKKGLSSIKPIFIEAGKVIASMDKTKFPFLAKEIAKGNQFKVQIIKSLINTKYSTGLTWEQSLAAVNYNI